MQLLHSIFGLKDPAEGGTLGRVVDAGRGELDEVSDYPASSGAGKNYWMPFGSVLFMELHL